MTFFDGRCAHAVSLRAFPAAATVGAAGLRIDHYWASQTVTRSAGTEARSTGLSSRLLLSVSWLSTLGWAVAWVVAVAIGVAVFFGLGKERQPRSPVA